MDLIVSLKTFVRVAETGSFSAVAVEKGMTQPAVSRQISALEDYLATRLFQRTTQAVTLTDDGRHLLQAAREIIDSVEAMQNSLGSRRSRPVGLVRLGVPIALGHQVTTRISEVLNKFSELSVELFMQDSIVNLVEDGLDLVVVNGDIEDASLISRRIGWTEHWVVAAASYLERSGIPAHPADLEDHCCLVHNGDCRKSTWWFSGPDRTPAQDNEFPVTVAGRFSTNNADAIYSAVKAGHGIACVSHHAVEEDVKAGKLVQILPRFKVRREPVNVVYSSRRHVPPRMRVMIDWLVNLPDTPVQMTEGLSLAAETA